MGMMMDREVAAEVGCVNVMVRLMVDDDDERWAWGWRGVMEGGLGMKRLKREDAVALEAWWWWLLVLCGDGGKG